LGDGVGKLLDFSMFTREDKFNSSISGIQTVIKYLESKTETIAVSQLDEQKNIVCWNYKIGESVKSVTIVVKSSSMTANYTCIVYDGNKLTPYPVCLKLVKSGFQVDYVAYYNLKNNICDLIDAR
jgi:hypothetical protein